MEHKERERYRDHLEKQEEGSILRQIESALDRDRMESEEGVSEGMG